MDDETYEQILQASVNGVPIDTWISTDLPTQLALLDWLKGVIVAAQDVGDYERAEAAVNCAWMIAHRLGTAELAAQAHWCSGLDLMGHKLYQAALEHFDATATYYQAVPAVAWRVQSNRAALLGRLGRLDEAASAIVAIEQMLPDVPAARDHLLSFLINRSDLEGHQGRYREMRETARTAEVEARRSAQPGSLVMALINHAFAAMFLADLDGAAEVLQQARQIATDDELLDLLARVVINQAHLEIIRDHPFRALHLLHDARAAFPSDARSEHATIAIEEARLYERLGLVEEARRCAQQATHHFAALDQPEECVEATLLVLRLALATGGIPGRLTRVQALIDQAQARNAAVSPPLQALLAAFSAHPLLHGTAQMAALAQADAAATTLERCGVPDFQIQASLIAADLATTLKQADAPARYRHCVTLAQQHPFPALEQQAYEGLARLERGAAACAAWQRAADLAAELRRRMPAEELKARALSSHAALSSRLVGAYLKLRRPQAALQALFDAKGSLWAELSAPTVIAPPSPDWVTARTRVTFLAAQLREGGEDDVGQHELQQALTALRLRERVRPAYPLPRLEEIQAQLPPASLAVEYLQGEQRIWACVLPASGLPHWVALGKTAVVIEAMERMTFYRRALQNQPPAQRRLAAIAQRPTINQSLARLYDLLVAPLRPWLDVERLVLAPDGALFDVPWAALYDQQQADGQPYVGERYELTLLPSLAVLALPRPAPASGPPTALGCSDTAQDIALQVDAELDTVQRLFPTARVINQAQVADLNATVAPRLLHLSAHGQLKHEEPLLSQIFLADGPFLLADAFNLALTGTELVLLSACETSAMPKQGGVALAVAGAFLAAGAQAVVAGLWRIDAEATARLVANLYGELCGGAELPAALRRAQQALRTAGYDHPYYWAALQPLMRTGAIRLV